MNNVTNWVFDLDNTLYKAECGLFDKVHVLMGRYIEEKLGLASGEAQALRSKYYHQYGTTPVSYTHLTLPTILLV